jgi:hypothetical protein
VSAPRPYADPYVAGVGLGLALLAAYVIVGRGLGASGAFATAAAAVVSAASDGAAPANPYFASRLGAGGPLQDWLVVELLGVVIGGALSAALAGRLRLAVERGPRVGSSTRLTLAVAGGLAMGVGAVIARGCTSGQALSGGALLSVGSWTFVAGAFGAGYAVAWVVRRAWT